MSALGPGPIDVESKATVRSIVDACEEGLRLIDLGSKNGTWAALVAQFEAYTWPGNVRELRNVVARRLALGELTSLDERLDAQSPETAGDFIGAVLGLRRALPAARQRVVEEFERRYVDRVLEEHSGNVLQAAAASGIARRYFYKLRARTGR